MKNPFKRKLNSYELLIQLKKLFSELGLHDIKIIEQELTKEIKKKNRKEYMKQLEQATINHMFIKKRNQDIIKQMEIIKSKEDKLEENGIKITDKEEENLLEIKEIKPIKETPQKVNFIGDWGELISPLMKKTYNEEKDEYRNHIKLNIESKNELEQIKFLNQETKEAIEPYQEEVIQEFMEKIENGKTD